MPHFFSSFRFFFGDSAGSTKRGKQGNAFALNALQKRSMSFDSNLSKWRQGQGHDPDPSTSGHDLESTQLLSLSAYNVHHSPVHDF